ncbi:hypothetical protein HCG45_16975 [Pseudomonas fulva]|uniref:hypothetical protein n=1 Tax=Pseudomonas fulva TaxID=47880 RepID=UPI001428A48F|nr:hypothetical protein [Pseudomonas fulva]NIX94428.1 hypothetical protein [Pseudomonas fulva]
MQWKSEQDKICSTIRANHSPLKVVLKIKDDWEMFPGFFDHHAQIVGAENIYIFDNMSTSKALLESFAALPYPENVFSFDSFHNDLHSPEKFSALYQALVDSCKHYTFLDSDERLCLLDGNSYSLSIIDYLKDIQTSVPGIWLSNAPGSHDIFALGAEGEKLQTGITWGKPILSSSVKVDGYINHNVQALEHVYEGLDQRSIFVLHLNNLSPSQRINANLRKLVARGFFNEKAGIEDALKATTTPATDFNIKLYLEEIRKLHNQVDLPTPSLSEGYLQLGPQNEIIFFSERERDLLQQFLDPDIIQVSPDRDNTLIELTRSPLPVSDLAQRYRGHVDGLFSEKITGWAVDYFGNNTSLKININGIERLIIHTINDRPDLKQSGISKGKGGFFVNLNGMVSPGDQVSITFLNDVLVSGGKILVP